MALEYWTIYTPATGAVRASGSGPSGSGAIQPLRAGEAVAPIAAQPGKQLLKIVSDKLVAVSNPDYQAISPTVTSQALQSADGTKWKLGVTNGGAITATPVSSS